MFEMVVPRRFVLMRFRDMGSHIGEHVADMAIGDVVINLAPVPDTAHQPRALEQAQMMARQLRRQAGRFGRRRRGQRTPTEGDDKAQARRISQQPKHVGELVNVVGLEAVRIKHFNSYLII